MQFLSFGYDMQLNTSSNVIAKCIIAHNCAYIIDLIDIEKQGLKGETLHHAD